MRSNWRECTLGDLVRVKHGYAFKGEFFGGEGTHVVLTPGNFEEAGGFKYKGEKEKWYSGPVPDDYVLNAGDLASSNAWRDLRRWRRRGQNGAIWLSVA